MAHHPAPLSVFICVLTVAILAFPPAPSSSEFREAFFPGRLRRSKRSMDEATAQQFLESQLDLHNCPGTTSCSLNSQMMRALTLQLRIEFRQLTDHLVTECPMGLTGLVAACENSTCPSPNMMLDVRYITNVLQWACAHKQVFQTSTGCWNRDFTHQMSQCLDQPPSDTSSVHDSVLRCFTGRLSRIPNCSTEAQHLFLDFLQITRDA